LQVLRLFSHSYIPFLADRRSPHVVFGIDADRGLVFVQDMQYEFPASALPTSSPAILMTQPAILKSHFSLLICSCCCLSGYCFCTSSGESLRLSVYTLLFSPSRRISSPENSVLSQLWTRYNCLNCPINEAGPRARGGLYRE